MYFGPLLTNTDPDCLSLCSAVMAMLQVIVERVSSLKAEVVLSCLQLHWSSFTGGQILVISHF